MPEVESAHVLIFLRQSIHVIPIFCSTTENTLLRRIRLSRWTCEKDLITRFSQVRLYKLVRLFTYCVRNYNLGNLNSHLQILLLSVPKKYHLIHTNVEHYKCSTSLNTECIEKIEYFRQRYLYCHLSHHALRSVWVSTYVWPNTLVAHETSASDQLCFSAFSTLHLRACGCKDWKVHMCGFFWNRVFMSNKVCCSSTQNTLFRRIRLSP